MTHVHFDLASIESKMRADLVTARETGDTMAAAGNADHVFIDAMRAFDEARIQFALAGLKAENDGIDRNIILSAAGHAIGSIWSNALGFALGARERAVLNVWVQQSLAASIGPQAAGRTIETVIAPMQSGTA